jgi:hypothetical protein
VSIAARFETALATAAAPGLEGPELPSSLFQTTTNWPVASKASSGSD